jgi:hypothetical protein
VFVAAALCRLGAMNDRYSLLNLDSTPDIPWTYQPQRQLLCCSFCGLGEGEVARLFEGWAGYICDECVDVCVQLLEEYREMGVGPPTRRQPWYKKLLGHENDAGNACSFNQHDRYNPQGERLFPGNEAQICDKCVRACEILKADFFVGG